MELTDITQPWAGTRLARLHAQGCRVVHGLGNWALRHLVELTAAWNVSAVHAQQQHQDSSSGPLTLVSALVIGIGSTAGVSMLLFKELRQTWKENDTILRDQIKFLREENIALRDHNSDIMRKMLDAESVNTTSIQMLTNEVVKLRGEVLRESGRNS